MAVCKVAKRVSAFAIVPPQTGYEMGGDVDEMFEGCVRFEACAYGAVWGVVGVCAIGRMDVLDGVAGLVEQLITDVWVAEPSEEPLDCEGIFGRAEGAVCGDAMDVCDVHGSCGVELEVDDCEAMAEAV